MTTSKNLQFDEARMVELEKRFVREGDEAMVKDCRAVLDWMRDGPWKPGVLSRGGPLHRISRKLKAEMGSG